MHFITWLLVEVGRSLLIYLPLHLTLYVLVKLTKPAEKWIKTEEQHILHQHHTQHHKGRYKHCTKGECAMKQKPSQNRLEQVSADLSQTL